jgi:hypothetical protein
LEKASWHQVKQILKIKGVINMSRNLIERLTEGVVNRDLQKEGAALLSKWEKTGLLEGLSGEHTRAGMARLLENQAKQLLKESTSMGAGDVQGFAAVAFPLVRRVFAGLLANDLVSVQPMSLPSGLIFFLDFTVSGELGTGSTTGRLGYAAASSLYGGGRVASEITGGVLLAGTNAEVGPYALNNGYAYPTGSGNITIGAAIASGTFGASQTNDALVRFDADFVSGSTTFSVHTVDLTQLAGANLASPDLVALTVTPASGSLVRRLTRLSGSSTTVAYVVFASYDGSVATTALDDNAGSRAATWPLQPDVFEAASAVGSVVGSNTTPTSWGLEGNSNIPEIDIKVDSIAVTAGTKKLKAKWTPELGQDLNAYHNLDAEVELTSILSEQIALEIDREILEDLIKGATAGTFYWSRSPGLFVNRTTGVEVGASSAAPEFTGTVSQWYETLIETINDVSAQIHRKTLRGGANFVVTSPEVANVLEFTAGFRASVTADDERGSIGAVKVGSISKKFDVHVDPYFPRNLLLVGRRGGSFLESGYVYAPYVPLQVTPTIFGNEDFVPRKGVMTRYAKKMVRPDMYGLVIVRGLLGESGA